MIHRFMLPVAAAFIVLSTCASSAIAEPALYKMTRIEPPPGWRRFALHAVNNAGDAAGLAYNRFPFESTLVIRHADGTFEYPSYPLGCDQDQNYLVLSFNDRSQMLVTGCNFFVMNSYTQVWDREKGWTRVIVGGGAYTSRGKRISNQGVVVGAAEKDGKDYGFIWRGPQDSEIVDHDGGIQFMGINDQGDIAASVTHIADPDSDYDRDGLTAALIPHDGSDPIYTGDGNIDTFKKYKDAEYRSYHLRSHAFAINNSGQIAIDSPKTFSNTRNTGCVWSRDRGAKCAHGHSHDSRDPVGIDGEGNIVMVERVKYPTSYVQRSRTGNVYELGLVADPPYTGDLIAYGMSEAGHIVGRFGGSFQSRTDAFLMTPIADR